MNRDYGLFLEEAKTWGLSPDEDFLEKADAFIDLLLSANKVMNLTAITEFEEICRNHLLDSLALFAIGLSGKEEPLLFAGDTRRVLDIGSGAGFPGIVLKLFCPTLDITLLDAQAKRVGFLQDVIERLSLNDEGRIRAEHGRAEDFAHAETERAQYDLVTARAVSKTAVLAEYALPLLKEGGIFAAYKARESEEEIDAASRALQILGGTLLAAPAYELPASNAGRRLVFVKKELATPDMYPRRAGIPEKKPL